MAKSKELSEYGYSDQLEAIKVLLDSLVRNQDIDWVHQLGEFHLNSIKKHCDYAIEKIFIQKVTK